MYQVDCEKRYDVTILEASQYAEAIECHENAEIVFIAPNFVVIRDKDGKEHIYTGTVGICIDEV